MKLKRSYKAQNNPNADVVDDIDFNDIELENKAPYYYYTSFALLVLIASMFMYCTFTTDSRNAEAFVQNCKDTCHRNNRIVKHINWVRKDCECGEEYAPGVNPLDSTYRFK